MKIDWILDETLPEEILSGMKGAADRSTKCEGVTLPCSVSVRLCGDEAIAEIAEKLRSGEDTGLK